MNVINEGENVHRSSGLYLFALILISNIFSLCPSRILWTKMFYLASKITCSSMTVGRVSGIAQIFPSLNNRARVQRVFAGIRLHLILP